MEDFLNYIKVSQDVTQRQLQRPPVKPGAHLGPQHPIIVSISPRHGTPGTPLLISGKFFGARKADILEVMVLGVSVMDSLQWISPETLRVTVGPLGGKGRVEITLINGKTGRSNVYFECRTPPVGYTEESSTWVEEPGWLSGKVDILKRAWFEPYLPYQRDIPAARIQRLLQYFPARATADITRPEFEPLYWLAAHAQNASIDDLKMILNHLNALTAPGMEHETQRKFLKDHIASVMNRFSYMEEVQMMMQELKKSSDTPRFTVWLDYLSEDTLDLLDILTIVGSNIADLPTTGLDPDTQSARFAHIREAKISQIERGKVLGIRTDVKKVEERLFGIAISELDREIEQEQLDEKRSSDALVVEDAVLMQSAVEQGSTNEPLQETWKEPDLVPDQISSVAETLRRWIWNRK